MARRYDQDFHEPTDQHDEPLHGEHAWRHKQHQLNAELVKGFADLGPDQGRSPWILVPEPRGTRPRHGSGPAWARGRPSTLLEIRRWEDLDWQHRTRTWNRPHFGCLQEAEEREASKGRRGECNPGTPSSSSVDLIVELGERAARDFLGELFDTFGGAVEKGLHVRLLSKAGAAHTDGSCNIRDGPSQVGLPIHNVALHLPANRTREVICRVMFWQR